MKKKTLVIMAAGMGSRFGGPKQILPVGPNGEFIIDYSIYDAIKVGFNRVVFIVSKEHLETVKNTIGKRISSHLDNIEYVVQENTERENAIPKLKSRVKPLGTAYAIMCTKNLINENFAVINSDDYYGPESFKIIGEFLDTLNEDCLECALPGYLATNTLAINEEEPVKRGICNINSNKLISLEESKIKKEKGVLKSIPLREEDVNYKEIPKDTIVSMNMFGFNQRVFILLDEGYEKFLNREDLENEEFLLPEEVSSWINKYSYKVHVINTNSKWFGITYKEDAEVVKNAINSFIAQDIYPLDLWKKKIN